MQTLSLLECHLNKSTALDEYMRLIKQYTADVVSTFHAIYDRSDEPLLIKELCATNTLAVINLEICGRSSQPGMQEHTRFLEACMRNAFFEHFWSEQHQQALVHTMTRIEKSLIFCTMNELANLYCQDVPAEPLLLAVESAMAAIERGDPLSEADRLVVSVCSNGAGTIDDPTATTVVVVAPNVQLNRVMRNILYLGKIVRSDKLMGILAVMCELADDAKENGGTIAGAQFKIAYDEQLAIMFGQEAWPCDADDGVTYTEWFNRITQSPYDCVIASWAIQACTCETHFLHNTDDIPLINDQ